MNAVNVVILELYTWCGGHKKLGQNMLHKKPHSQKHSKFNSLEVTGDLPISKILK